MIIDYDDLYDEGKYRKWESSDFEQYLLVMRPERDVVWNRIFSNGAGMKNELSHTLATNMIWMPHARHIGVQVVERFLQTCERHRKPQLKQRTFVWWELILIV